MKSLVKLFLALIVATFSAVVWAQTEPVSYDEFVAFLLQSMGGFKGASTMAAVALVVQILMKLIQTNAGELLGKWKLLTVSLLSLVGGVLALKLTGLTWGASLLHSATLASLQVFLHQGYKQFIEKKE